MARSFVDAVFGCCLGHRHGRGPGNNEDGAGPSDLSRASQSNERTPLLAGQRSAAAKAGAEGGDAHALAGDEAIIDEIGGAHGDRGNNDKVKAQKRRTVDAERLRAISDQAQAAFFDVESSQLLPSSSSLAQRQASMGASQRLNRRDEALSVSRGAAQTGGKAGSALDSASVRKNKALMAASDRAERLYTAALVAEASAAADDSDGRIKGKNGAAHKGNDDRNGKQTVVPISLVRPVRLSLHDKKAVSKRRSAGQTSTTDAVESPAVTGEDVSSAAGGSTASARMHTLRTLQLVRADSSDALHGDFDEDIDKSGHLTANRQFHSTPSSSSPAAHSHDDDDEEWARRGRTRSKRSLIWLDTTGQANAQQANGQGDASDAHIGADDAQAASPKGNGNDITGSVEEEAHEALHAIRLDGGQMSNSTGAGHTSEKRQQLREHLSASIKEPLAEVWEVNGAQSGTNRGAAGAGGATAAASVSERS